MDNEIPTSSIDESSLHNIRRCNGFCCSKRYRSISISSDISKNEKVNIFLRVFVLHFGFKYIFRFFSQEFFFALIIRHLVLLGTFFYSIKEPMNTVSNEESPTVGRLILETKED